MSVLRVRVPICIQAAFLLAPFGSLKKEVRFAYRSGNTTYQSIFFNELINILLNFGIRNGYTVTFPLQLDRLAPQLLKDNISDSIPQLHP